ncbi:phage tail assembly protein [Plasticicumulans sp.]|uniref:phage tail assembly protein n=1 Tax=Plasticicumulans sp. TaxID=2307179 RepID=UPI0032207298
MSDEREVVTLRYPVEFGGRRIEELRLRRPRAGDLIATDRVQGAHAKDAALAGHLAEVEPEVIRALDGADWMAVREVLAGFLFPIQAASDVP